MATLAPVVSAAVLLDDDTGGITDARQLVIEDNATFQRIWAEAISRRENAPPAPSIDFESEMVILVSAGRMRVGGQIVVDSVGVRPERTEEGETEDFFAVKYHTIEACGGLDTPVYPVQIVRVVKFDREMVRFQRGSAERGAGCTEELIGSALERAPALAVWRTEPAGHALGR